MIRKLCFCLALGLISIVRTDDEHGTHALFENLSDHFNDVFKTSDSEPLFERNLIDQNIQKIAKSRPSLRARKPEASAQEIAAGKPAEAKSTQTEDRQLSNPLENEPEHDRGHTEEKSQIRIIEHGDVRSIKSVKEEKSTKSRVEREANDVSHVVEEDINLDGNEQSVKRGQSQKPLVNQRKFRKRMQVQKIVHDDLVNDDNDFKELVINKYSDEDYDNYFLPGDTGAIHQAFSDSYTIHHDASSDDDISDVNLQGVLQDIDHLEASNQEFAAQTVQQPPQYYQFAPVPFAFQPEIQTQQEIPIIIPAQEEPSFEQEGLRVVQGVAALAEADQEIAPRKKILIDGPVHEIPKIQTRTPIIQQQTIPMYQVFQPAMPLAQDDEEEYKHEYNPNIMQAMQAYGLPHRAPLQFQQPQIIPQYSYMPQQMPFINPAMFQMSYQPEYQTEPITQSLEELRQNLRTIQDNENQHSQQLEKLTGISIPDQSQLGLPQQTLPQQTVIENNTENTLTQLQSENNDKNHITLSVHLNDNGTELHNNLSGQTGSEEMNTGLGSEGSFSPQLIEQAQPIQSQVEFSDPNVSINAGTQTDGSQFSPQQTDQLGFINLEQNRMRNLFGYPYMAIPRFLEDSPTPPPTINPPIDLQMAAKGSKGVHTSPKKQLSNDRNLSLGLNINPKADKQAFDEKIDNYKKMIDEVIKHQLMKKIVDNNFMDADIKDLI